MVGHKLSRVLPVALCVAALSGCPVSVSADGIDGFTVNSAQWMAFSTGGSLRHELIATSISSYCSKRQNGEAERQAAYDAHQQRLADGVSLCESLDMWHDDIAAAFNPLEQAGASYLRATLAREVDSSDLDAITAPAEGRYVQLGGGADGGFVSSIQHHQARYNQQIADAFSCDELDPAELDDPIAVAMLGAGSVAEAEPPESFVLSAGELDITEVSATKRDVDISGDILENSTTVGGLSASFTATRCEVELADELDF